MNLKEDGKKEYTIKLSKPYKFENNSYDILDLSGLENITAEEYYEINKRFATESYITPKPEIDPKFCTMIAALAIKQPEIFFDKLPIKDLIKVKDMVITFFHEEE